MEEIKVGDKVYYRYRIGMFNRTKSGTVLSIDNDVAVISVIPYGNREKVSLRILSKNKKQ